MTLMIAHKLNLTSLLIIILLSPLIYLSSESLIEEKIAQSESHSAEALLDNIHSLLEYLEEDLNGFRTIVINKHKLQIRNTVDVAESLVTEYYQRFISGELSEDEAKRQALIYITKLRSGSDNYLLNP